MITKPCKYCNGKGREPNLVTALIENIPKPCSVCMGKGFNSFNCVDTDLIECKCCNGTGKLILPIINTTNKCESCQGTGFINLLQNESSEILDFWQLIDERIAKVSKTRFDNRHYADSVEAAFKEINSEVKAIVFKSTDHEFDGSSLMERAFSINNPIIIIDELTSENGKNIQKGFLQIFSGSMTGIRNPKAHSNRTINRELAIHYLFLASLLMSKVPKRK